MCVTAGFCVEAIYTPPPPSPYVREPSECAYTSSLHFLRENHLRIVLRSRYYNPTTRILISSLPQVAFHSNHLSSIAKSERERVVCWGDYHFKHKSKEFIINTPSITFWRVVSPRLVRCRLGASVKMWS